MNDQLSKSLKEQATGLGFQYAGICPAVTPLGFDRFEQWLQSGYAGQMHYLPARAAAYEHPEAILEGVRSVVMLAMVYRTQQAQPVTAGAGRVASYAWGQQDYHDLIHDRLKQLRQHLETQVPGALVRGVVDTAPLLEREFAQLAGLGWIGKNTLLLNKEAGSWFFLAALLTDQELVYDEPSETDHCGTCRACLDACPTDAFPQPYVLDATRCISYLTIELRDHIPTQLRRGMGDWVFGCDICQDVCPWNSDTPASQEAGLQPLDPLNPVALHELFELDDESFRARFRRSPLWRSKRRGILRNAAIVLGNQGSIESLQPLCQGLLDEEPLVRAASAWALGQLAIPLAKEALSRQLDVEPDAHVEAEIQQALVFADSG
jgi:epoxyqueuosine reductase